MNSLTPNARHLRKNLTDAEKRLWREIRLRQVKGFKFRRQFPIGRYIADFVCPEQKLIVEVDGGQHSEQINYDAERTKWLESQGFRVLRFWSNEVQMNLEGVKEIIFNALEERDDPPPQPSPTRGEGVRKGLPPWWGKVWMGGIIAVFKKIQHIHFVGIGGSGMSGIAEVLVNLGYKVSGSDLKATPVTDRLEKLGVRIAIGHRPQNIDGVHVVVTSTAVSTQNPEVMAARTQGIPVIPRIEMLAEIARLKYTIAIAGTHGKTTTTSMVASVLQAGGLDPTVIVGGRLKHLDSGARLGKGDFLVAEADESDGSFLKLSPALAVITNIDNDHLDYYGTFDKIADAFVQYAGRVPFYGCVIVCLDDPHVRVHLPRISRRVVTYGIESGARVQAFHIQTTDAWTTFEAVENGKILGTVKLQVPGRHNVLNALAAVAVGLELGISFAKITEGLAAYDGVGRRLEIKGERDGILVIDDYGHHPTEIRATLSALKDRYPKRRLVALFQPHRFTRTQSLWSDFAQAFDKADQVYVMDIYPAGEEAIPGVTSELITKAMEKTHPQAGAAPKPFSIGALKSGDVFLTLGAGDVWKVGEQLLENNVRR